MVCLFVVWLHTHGHISCSVANKTLRAIQYFLSTLLLLIQVALVSFGFNVSLSTIHIPNDVHSAYQTFCPEPDFICTVCCPKCFSLFPVTASGFGPSRCTWKESPRAKACNTELYEVKQQSNGLKKIPKMQYTTQSFKSWLKFFLSREIIETSLKNTFHNNQNAVLFGGEMQDIHDSPGWQDLYRSATSPRDLQFGIYVDWFNLFTNKIAGKTVSCGAIVLYCLNLPPDLRYRPENTFIIGLTPPPRAPTMITICHLLEPIIGPAFKFSKDQINIIRQCIQGVTLPTWAQRPPTNLGEHSHGKLKAHEYLTLFTTIFPLIIPELWY